MFHCRDAEEAKARACLEGVHLANRWPDIPMILESDCQSVVTQLQAKIHDCSVLWQVIEEARDVGGQLRRMDTVKISRDQNKLAHELVQFAIRFRKCQSFFFACFPEWVKSLSCKYAT